MREKIVIFIGQAPLTCLYSHLVGTEEIWVRIRETQKVGTVLGICRYSLWNHDKSSDRWSGRVLYANTKGLSPTLTSSDVAISERFSWIGGWFSIAGHLKVFYAFSKLPFGICVQLAMILYLKHQSRGLLNCHFETTYTMTNGFMADNIALCSSCLDLGERSL